MAVAAETIIDHTHWNALVQKLVNEYSNKFGQLLDPRVKSKTTGDLIESLDWLAIANDILDLAYFSQTGVFTLKSQVHAISFTSSVFADEYPMSIPSGTVIDAVDYNELEALIDASTAIIDSSAFKSRLSIDNNPYSYTEQWQNLLFETIIDFEGGYEYTFSANGSTSTATSAQHIQHFSNANFLLRTVISGFGSDGSEKDNDWEDMLDSIGTNDIDPLSYSNNAYVDIAENTGNTTYSQNIVELQIKKDSFKRYIIKLEARDRSTSPSNNPLYDENVNTDVQFDTAVLYAADRLGNNLAPTIYDVIESQPSIPGGEAISELYYLEGAKFGGISGYSSYAVPNVGSMLDNSAAQFDVGWDSNDTIAVTDILTNADGRGLGQFQIISPDAQIPVVGTWSTLTITDKTTQQAVSFSRAQANNPDGVEGTDTVNATRTWFWTVNPQPNQVGTSIFPAGFTLNGGTFIISVS